LRRFDHSNLKHFTFSNHLKLGSIAKKIVGVL